jgi:hypothetical protein
MDTTPSVGKSADELAPNIYMLKEAITIARLGMAALHL